MPSILDSIGDQPVHSFCDIRPFADDQPHPTVGQSVFPYLERLTDASLPVVWGSGDREGTLWGGLSLFDICHDVRQAVRSRHSLSTYRFQRLKVGPGKVGSPILRAITPTSRVSSLMQWFATGTRRVFVVDEQQRPVGTVELADVIRRLVDMHPELLADLTVDRVMFHNERELHVVLAAPLWEALLQFSRWRKVVFVYVLGRYTLPLTPVSIIRRLAECNSDIT
ncbi:MAG: CBS domain-containing protein, partial [Bdellovibrionales bacterium]|nr:CBS domain-containing protein [Bdellovibrionales bacterium]